MLRCSSHHYVETGRNSPETGRYFSPEVEKHLYHNIEMYFYHNKGVRLRNVRNYLSDVLLNYNERISRTDLSMTRVVECERLAEMICELFQDEMQDTDDDDDFTDEHELHVEFVRYEEEDLPF